MIPFALSNTVASDYLVGCRINDRNNALVLQVDVTTIPASDNLTGRPLSNESMPALDRTEMDGSIVLTPVSMRANQIRRGWGGE